MKLEAVTVSVGYADYLSETVKWNKNLFDRWVVVTSEDDTATREVCRRNRVQCLVTADHDRDGPFSKGRLVERGLQQLSAETWVMHLDGDIVFPQTLHHDLDRAHLEEDKIYGFDRFQVATPEAWAELQASGWLHNPSEWHPHGVGIPCGFPLMGRWAGQDGWVPIGFAQLWHRTGGGEEWRGYRTKSYPQHHGKACRTDVQHSLQWDRRDRALVPEVFVAHLGSDGAKVGANWQGRTTPAFSVKAPS